MFIGPLCGRCLATHRSLCAINVVFISLSSRKILLHVRPEPHSWRPSPSADLSIESVYALADNYVLLLCTFIGLPASMGAHDQCNNQQVAIEDFSKKKRGLKADDEEML